MFTDDIITYIENLKESRRKKDLQELISDYSKVAGYKINIQKSITFLYTSNEQGEFKIKNKILFTLAPLQNKILGNKTKKICTLCM